MGTSGDNNKTKNEVSFRCTYFIPKGNINDKMRIINDRDLSKNINKEIKSKIKILNGNRKEKLIFEKKFDKIGENTIDFIIEGKLTNMSFMFQLCLALIKVEFIDIDSSLVESMKSMFQFCKRLNEIEGINNINTSNIRDMSMMFHGCSIEYLDLSNFNTAQVENIGLMFGWNNRLKEIKGLNNFNTSNIFNMRELFSGCNSLELIDLSNFDTSKVEDMGQMFSGCSKLKEIKGINTFNTSKVTNMSYMFSDCEELEYLDLSNLDTSKVGNMSYMFSGCSKLKEIKGINTFNTSKVSMMNYMFSGCNSLELLDLSNFDTSNVFWIEKIFSGCSKLKEIKGLYNFSYEINEELAKGWVIKEMFEGCKELKDLDYLIISNKKITIDTNKLFSKFNIAVLFISTNQSIRYALSCNISDKFSSLEEKLFNEYPELKNKNIKYLVNNTAIDKSKTLKENNIKDSGTTIMIDYS